MAAPAGQTAHRPWPVPCAPWVVAMVWHDLLFAHWPVPPGALRPLIPAGLELETFPDASGREAAWVGVVPFTMTGVRARCTPAIPGPGAFHEINVRTYVCSAHPPAFPGVWFFSLDAASRVAVWAARAAFRLPYYHARMSLRREGTRVHYESSRTGWDGPAARFRAEYGPAAPAGRARPGTLEHWLTERYCLYSVTRRGRLLRADIHHEPWPLRPATASVEVNTMTAPIGVALPDAPPLLHFAERLEVVAWAARRA